MRDQEIEPKQEPRTNLIQAIKWAYESTRLLLQGFDPVKEQKIKKESHKLLVRVLKPLTLSIDKSYHHLQNHTGLSVAQSNLLLEAAIRLILNEEYVQLESKHFTKNTPTTEYWIEFSISESERVQFALIISSKTNEIVGVHVVVSEGPVHKPNKTHVYAYPDDIGGQGNALLSADSKSLPAVEAAVRLLITYRTVPREGTLTVTQDGQSLIETIRYQDSKTNHSKSFIFNLINPDDTSTGIALYLSRKVIY